jgi:hypothetical protein
MKFSLFKTHAKAEDKLHCLFASVVRTECFTKGPGSISQLKHERLSCRRECHSSPPASPKGNRTQESPPSDPKRSCVSVIGCRIENDTDSFEKHEFAAIGQRIEEVYCADVYSIIRHRHTYDSTIVADLSIDAFGNVNMVDILHPATSKNDTFRKEAEKRIAKWTFPAILRQGRCRVVFTRRSTITPQ